MTTINIATYDMPETLYDLIPEDVMDIEIEFNYWPAVQGNRSGHPDSWTPDENEDWEVTSISFKTRGEWKAIKNISEEVELSLYKYIKAWYDESINDY